MSGRNLRPSGVPYNNGVPNPLRCQLWSWVDGVHVQCRRHAVVESAVPGRITMHVCGECHQQRLKETKHGH